MNFAPAPPSLRSGARWSVLTPCTIDQTNCASVTETPQQADLALTKTVDVPTPNVGDIITFTVTLTNKGTDPATHVEVQDVLPAGLSFLFYTASQGTYLASTGLWNVGTVTPAVPQTRRRRPRSRR